MSRTRSFLFAAAYRPNERARTGTDTHLLSDLHSPACSFFGRVESLLRRSINVPQSAKVSPPSIKPAPEVEAGPLSNKVAADPVVAEEEEVEFDLEKDLPTRAEEEREAERQQAGGEGAFSQEQMEEMMRMMEQEQDQEGGRIRDEL